MVSRSGDPQRQTRAALYLRINRDDAAGLMLDSQRDQCTQAAEERGLVIVGEYADRPTRTKPPRAEFAALVERIRTRNDVGAVVVSSLSRIARDPVRLVDACASLRDLGVKIVSATELLDRCELRPQIVDALARLNDLLREKGATRGA